MDFASNFRWFQKIPPNNVVRAVSYIAQLSTPRANEPLHMPTGTECKPDLFYAGSLQRRFTFSEYVIKGKFEFDQLVILVVLWTGFPRIRVQQ